MENEIGRASLLQTIAGDGLSDGFLWLAGTNAGWGWDRALRRPDGCRQAVRTRPLYSKKLERPFFCLVGMTSAIGCLILAPIVVAHAKKNYWNECPAPQTRFPYHVFSKALYILLIRAARKQFVMSF